MQVASGNIMPQNPPTFINILLDESGSMGYCHTETVNGFNSFVDEQKTIEGDCYLTLSKFDSGEVKTPYVNLPIEMVPELIFNPRGGTNLYDVVGKTITDILSQDRNGKSLILIITDGEDNSSKEFNPNSVNQLVNKALEKNISFMYFGAGLNAKSVALSMGIPDNSITIFETSNMAYTLNAMSSATRAFRTS